MSPASLVIRVSVVAVHVGRRTTVFNHTDRFTTGHVLRQPWHTTAGARLVLLDEQRPAPTRETLFGGVSITAQAA